MPIYKKVNKKFFKKWTREMAYVLGFFAADGYMTLNKRGACFWSIQITDKKLLMEIRKIIESEHAISVRKGKGNEKDLYRLQIGSKEMFRNLMNLGMKQNKTKSLVLPKVPDEYLSSFVRGYFDGDGHVWFGIINKERKAPHYVIQTVFTSCSSDFLENLKVRLEKAGIEKGRIRKGKGEFYRLAYSVLNSLKLQDFMYNKLYSSKLFLNRKRVVFEKYIKMRA